MCKQLTSFLFLLHCIDAFVKRVYVIADLIAEGSLSYFYVPEHLLEMEQNSRVCRLSNAVGRVQTFLQQLNLVLQILDSERTFFLFS
jgi:hypothetical protein